MLCFWQEFAYNGGWRIGIKWIDGTLYDRLEGCASVLIIGGESLLSAVSIYVISVIFT